jgi:hypothetical protein
VKKLYSPGNRKSFLKKDCKNLLLSQNFREFLSLHFFAAEGKTSLEINVLFYHIAIEAIEDGKER